MNTGIGSTAAGDAPVVHQTAFKHGIGFGNVVDRKCLLKDAALLALADDLTQQLIIGAVRTHHVLFAAGDELSRVELAQQIDRYGVVGSSGTTPDS